MRYASIARRLDGLGFDKWAVHMEGRARALKGQEMIFLSIGEPDLPPPAAVLDTAVESIRAGRTKYADGQGEPGARRAVAAHLTRRSGHEDAATLINAALREHIRRADEPLERTLRRVLREELRKVG